MQDLVQQFHEKYGHPVGQPGCWEKVDPLVLDLRIKLIREEAQETTDALERLALCRTHPHKVTQEFTKEQALEVVDGLCDLIYVSLGTAISLGVDLAPHFAEVHRANMDKTPVVKMAHEKYGPGGGKPESWRPPDHASILDRVR